MGRNEFGVESNDSGGFGDAGFEDFESMLAMANDASELEDDAVLSLDSLMDSAPKTPKRVRSKEPIVEESVSIEVDVPQLDDELNDEEFLESPENFDFASFADEPEVSNEPAYSESDTSDDFIGFSEQPFNIEQETESEDDQNFDEPSPASILDEVFGDSEPVQVEAQKPIRRSRPAEPLRSQEPDVEPITEDDVIDNSSILDSVLAAHDEVHKAPVRESIPAPRRAKKVEQQVNQIKQQEPAPKKSEPANIEPIEIEVEEVIEAAQNEEPVNNNVVINNSGLDIESVTKVIKTIDSIRQLNDDSAVKMANIYITNGNPVKSDYELVLAAINCDRQLMKTTTSLIESKKQDKVDRAFTILALDDITFVALGDLVKSSGDVGLPDDFSFTGDRLKYARALVDAIDKMSDESVDYVSATQIILSASE